jgi:hypothetical protein
MILKNALWFEDLQTPEKNNRLYKINIQAIS